MWFYPYAAIDRMKINKKKRVGNLDVFITHRLFTPIPSVLIVDLSSFELVSCGFNAFGALFVCSMFWCRLGTWCFYVRRDTEVQWSHKVQEYPKYCTSGSVGLHEEKDKEIHSPGRPGGVARPGEPLDLVAAKPKEGNAHAPDRANQETPIFPPFTLPGQPGDQTRKFTYVPDRVDLLIRRNFWITVARPGGFFETGFFGFFSRFCKKYK